MLDMQPKGRGFNSHSRHLHFFQRSLFVRYYKPSFVYIHICIYVYILNLQKVLFRPLRSHQCSSEWFENWDMSIARRAINTSHNQWHILFLYICIYIDMSQFSNHSELH